MKDERLFTKIVEQHKQTIYTVCYMFSDDRETVNDLFQDTLVNLWKGFEAFRGESNVGTWIWRVALNTCISAERKQKRRPDTVELTMESNLYDDDDADSQQVRQLHRRIGRLGLIDRAIVLLWLEDLSYDEIGEIVGISPQNVGVKLFRIKEKLRKAKDDDADEGAKNSLDGEAARSN